MKLLLIDDEPMNVELFVDSLEASGHSVAVERDGPGGLARGLNEEFDLILLDVQLPGASGLQVASALRAASVRTPILALTSSAMEGDAERGLAAGFDEYLTKPISPTRLRAAVARYAK